MENEVVPKVVPMMVQPKILKGVLSQFPVTPSATNGSLFSPHGSCVMGPWAIGIDSTGKAVVQHRTAAADIWNAAWNPNTWQSNALTGDFTHTYITLHYITLRYVTLHYITLHTYIFIYIYIYIFIYIVSWFPGPWYSRFFPISVAPYSSPIDQSSPTLRSRPPLWCEQCGAPACCCGANGKVEILGDFHGKTMIRTHAIWWFIYVSLFTSFIVFLLLKKVNDVVITIQHLFSMEDNGQIQMTNSPNCEWKKRDESLPSGNLT